MFRKLLPLIAFLLPRPVSAGDIWWSYMAGYENDTPGSTRVNLGLKERAPVAGYPHLIVTGTTYKSTGFKGLPDLADLDRLNALSEKVVATIAAKSPAIYAGTFSNQYEQLHYVYVRDTAGIEAALRTLYAHACAGCKVYINVKSDPQWLGYKEFLYPNQATRDFYRKELTGLGLGNP